jgi:Flp pilus assembly protein TadG
VPAAADDRGAAAVEFVLVSILLVTLLLAVVQVGVYLHVRNVVAASAAEGVRYAANADRDSAEAGPRTQEIVAAALNARLAGALAYDPAEVAGAGGATLVSVHVTGAMPTVVAQLGGLLPLDVTARALKEGR